ncbi:MAG: sialidase family protein [Steroidobacteraceae bacterium]
MATNDSVLSPGNAAGQDEDPVTLRARDESLFVAWYSNRNGTQPDGYDDKEIFLMHSTDGRSWTNPPIQLTRTPRYSFYPSLAQDASGQFHLAGMRTIFQPDGCVPTNSCTGAQYSIFTKSSADGVTWNADAENTVAAGPADQMPWIVADRQADRLLIFFCSPTRDANGNVQFVDFTQNLYVTVDSGTGWSTPQRLVGPNAPGTGNVFPYVVQRSDGQFLMTWVRYEAAIPDAVDTLREISTDVLWATSADGVVWSSPATVSDADTLAEIDILPSLYLHTVRNNWNIIWRTGSNPADPGRSVEMPVGGSYPTDLLTRPELAGYSARILATPTTGIFWGVWVAGDEPRQKIHHRFFTLP